MFPAAFDYRAPSSLAEAVDILRQRGEEAKIMAGGQSLIPLLKLRFSQPALVVDIGRLPNLAGVERKDGHLRVGALTRHVQIDSNTELRTLCPILPEAAHWIADPQGDWGSVMLALDADFVARSESGERIIKAADFFQGPFTTALRPDEVLTEIRIPLAAHSAGAYNKLERKVGDFATVAVAVQVEMNGDKIAKAGIGLTSVGDRNLKARDAEKSLAGKQPTDEAIAEAARLAAAAAEPKADVRGSAEFKRDIVRVFVQRGLKTAVARARGGQ